MSRHVLDRLDPAATVMVLPADEAMALVLAPRRLMQIAVMALAVLALALAVVNIWALSAWSVIERSREFGVRLALGATQAQTVQLVMRRGLVSIGFGLAIGLVATFTLARPAIRSQIASLSSPEAWLTGVAVAAVTIVAVLGCWMPARSVSRIDPAIALRAE